jgi:hypothetical protein
MEQFTLMFECEDCKKKFPIIQDEAPNSLTHKKEFNINGKSIFLTYYDCPSCGRRHYVQIDDAKSLGDLELVRKMFIDLSIARRKGKEISRKQSAKFKKARQDLSDYRMKLMKAYTGTLIRNNETDSYSELRFSIW